MYGGSIFHDMYRILMPIDEDESRVTAQTETVLELLAVAEDVEVTLLSVFAEQDRADESTAAQTARGKLEAADATVESRYEVGDPAETILATARKVGANQIVLGGRKRSPLGALVFGSVSQTVVREATVPVMITGSADRLERPSHRCVNCGETYYTELATEIKTCRNCGGVHVESLRDPPSEPAM